MRKTGAVVTFTFAAAGSYEVELEIEHGSIDTEVKRIVTVGGQGNGNPNGKPLDFTFSPVSPRAGQQVTFTATGDTAGPGELIDHIKVSR